MRKKEDKETTKVKKQEENENVIEDIKVEKAKKASKKDIKKEPTNAILEQKPENEGYWTIELSNYLYNGINYSGSFSFYLIFNTSYTGSVEELGQVYNVSPNLLCNGNPIATNESGVRTYKLDENTSFPVITYKISIKLRSYSKRKHNKLCLRKFAKQ